MARPFVYDLPGRDRVVYRRFCVAERVEPYLHVIGVVSNPIGFARRYQLAREFMRRMDLEADVVRLYVVELVYGDAQLFAVTSPDNPRHLQLRCAGAPLWHKENMINLGVARLLPPDWRAFAWIDMDVEFDSPNWADLTLRALSCFDVVQLFSHVLDLNRDEDPMHVHGGFAYQFSRGKAFRAAGGATGWHPGFAWACTRFAYERMGGLYEHNVLGGGDSVIAKALIGHRALAESQGFQRQYVEHVDAWQRRAFGLRLGYVPGLVRHYFHGSKRNRRYLDRYKLLVKHRYTPDMLEPAPPQSQAPGLLLLREQPALAQDVMKYFAERREDD